MFKCNDICLFSYLIYVYYVRSSPILITICEPCIREPEISTKAANPSRSSSTAVSISPMHHNTQSAIVSNGISRGDTGEIELTTVEL